CMPYAKVAKFLQAWGKAAGATLPYEAPPLEADSAPQRLIEGDDAPRSEPSLADQLVALELIALGNQPDVAGMHEFCYAQKWCPARGKIKLTKAGKDRLAEL